MRALYDVPAPAKLNLFLHVTGRRADGRHLLQSAFVLLDWHDTLHFEQRSDGHIRREDLTAPLPPDDLCTRAARLLQEHTGCGLGATIGVHKSIPPQAGLGGGSSNAATTLLALNRLWGVDLPRSELMALGARLGADVPFFLYGDNAWVEGVGRPLQALALPAASFMVIKPPAGLDTGQIFAAEALQRDHAPATIPDFAAAPFEFGQNDLQPVAEALCPDIGLALQALAGGGLRGRMTGAGSAVFALAPDSIDARHEAMRELPRSWDVRLCSLLPSHPLRGWARTDG